MRSRILLSVALLVAACSGEIGSVEPGDSGDSGDSGDDSGDDAPPPPDAGVPGAPDAAPWHPGMTLADRACPDGSIVSWQNFAAGFVAAYCTGCHSARIPMGMRQGAPPGVNFDTPEGIAMHAERIYARAGDGFDTMPPAGGPSIEARTLLGDWLGCGLPGLPP